MSEFIHRQGPAFLANVLRRLADELIQGAAAWYPTVGVTAPPRTVSTLLALDEHGPLGVTGLADLLGQSHTLVIVWVKELSRLSLVTSRTDRSDRRRTLIRLTDKGRQEVLKIRQALVIMERASTQLLDLAGKEAWQGLWAMEQGCRERSFLERLRHAAASENERESAGG